MLLRLWSCWVLAGMVFVPTIEGDFIKETAVTEDIVGQVPCTSWVARRAYKTCREDITLLFALSLSLPLSLSLSLSLILSLSCTKTHTNTFTYPEVTLESILLRRASRALCNCLGALPFCLRCFSSFALDFSFLRRKIT